MKQVLSVNMDFKAMVVLLLLVINITACEAAMKSHMTKGVITNVYGDVYDCVHRYRQPAFNHISFKDHKIKPMPSERLYKSMNLNQSDRNSVKPHHFGFRNGCPQGYVPIQRVTHNRSSGIRETGFHSLLQEEEVVPMYAGLKSRFQQGSEFQGVDAYIAVYKPLVFEAHQSTSAIISVIGEQSEDSQIIAGWTVNPELNKDEKTRVLIGWTNDRFQSIGCYNLLCPGFVLTGSLNPIGGPIAQVSYRDTAYDMRFTIARDETDRKWWLFIGSSPIGYWPHWLFTSPLQAGCNKIYWGGVVYTPPDAYRKPQMGSGVIKIGEATCYMRHTLYCNNLFQWLSLDDYFSFDVIYHDPWYFTEYYGMKGGALGYFFYFGGNGKH